MPGEKQNSWQQRLGDLNSLPPAVSFDREAGWQELEKALQKRKRKFGFVWAAAVMLLLASGGILLYPSPQPSTGAKQSIVTRPPATTSLPSGNKVEVKREESIVNNKPSIRKKTQLAKRVMVATELPEPIDTVAMKVGPIEETKVIEQPLNSDLSTTATPTSKKRRFPVAHINELHQQPNKVVQKPESLYANALRSSGHPEYRSTLFGRPKTGATSSNTNRP